MKKTLTKYQGLRGLEVLEGANNYNNWIAESFVDDLKPPVLEIGAGMGNITKHFLKNRPIVITDIDPYFLNFLRKKFRTNQNVYIEKFDITKGPPKKFKSYFNTIVGINVLEHIENDEACFKNLGKALRENGTLCLLVPAKKWSYTKLDFEIGHFRRYEKKELIDKLEKCGFAIEKIYFFNFLGLLSWKVRDRVQKEIYIPQNQVRIFDSIVPFLKIIEGFIKPPIGISLIVVARKISSVSN